MNTLTDYEIAILDKLVKNGDIYSYKTTDMGVKLEFSSGIVVEFSANSGPTDDAFLDIEEVA